MLGKIDIVKGDARHLDMPDGSVDLIVTSPPFWSLRSYTDGGEHYAGQIGAEPTPAAYIDSLIECTREWARVLKPTGSLWVNLGDKYSTGSSGQSAMARLGESYAGGGHTQAKAKTRSGRVGGMPPKSLIGLPWRYAIRCIDELGLILRAEVIWSKPNGLPESVRDRVRRSHEQWFHFTRSPRYFAAVDTIREAHAERYADRVARYGGRDRDSLPSRQYATGDRKDSGDAKGILGLNRSGSLDPLGKLPGSVWTIATQPLKVPAELGIDHFAAFPMEWPRRIISGWSPSGICTACGDGRRPVVVTDLGRKERETPAYGAGNHGTGGSTLGSRGSSATILGEACACTPYTDHPGTGESSRMGDSRETGLAQRSRNGDVGNAPRTGPWREYHLANWHDRPPTVPAVVLDPFGGTGTTALVAAALGRHGISVDMSADYCRLAEWRTTDPAQIERAGRANRTPGKR
jgi:DNA modification methylase